MNDLTELKREVMEKRNELSRCPVCNQGIEDRRISIFQELIECLYRVYCWCGENRKHEFETKEISHLFRGNDYARFGDLVRIGGLLYKPKDETGKSRKAWFGLNMARTKQFFAGEYKIPVQIIINQITNEIINSRYVSIGEFPSLVQFINDEGLYDYEKDLIRQEQLI
jgi:hypothetical protein